MNNTTLAVKQLQREILESRIRGYEWALEIDNFSTKFLRDITILELARAKEALKILLEA